jgi:hypothetical protein
MDDKTQSFNLLVPSKTSYYGTTDCGNRYYYPNTHRSTEFGFGVYSSRNPPRTIDNLAHPISDSDLAKKEVFRIIRTKTEFPGFSGVGERIEYILQQVVSSSNEEQGTSLYKNDKLRDYIQSNITIILKELIQSNYIEGMTYSDKGFKRIYSHKLNKT